jgi:hypothetical protein
MQRLGSPGRTMASSAIDEGTWPVLGYSSFALASFFRRSRKGSTKLITAGGMTRISQNPLQRRFCPVQLAFELREVSLRRRKQRITKVHDQIYSSHIPVLAFATSLYAASQYALLSSPIHRNESSAQRGIFSKCSLSTLAITVCPCKASSSKKES